VADRQPYWVCSWHTASSAFLRGTIPSYYIPSPSLPKSLVIITDWSVVSTVALPPALGGTPEARALWSKHVSSKSLRSSNVHDLGSFGEVKPMKTDIKGAVIRRLSKPAARRRPVQYTPANGTVAGVEIARPQWGKTSCSPGSIGRQRVWGGPHRRAEAIGVPSISASVCLDGGDKY